jgi:hypothetical protein
VVVTGTPPFLSAFEQDHGSRNCGTCGEYVVLLGSLIAPPALECRAAGNGGERHGKQQVPEPLDRVVSQAHIAERGTFVDEDQHQHESSRSSIAIAMDVNETARSTSPSL